MVGFLHLALDGSTCREALQYVAGHDTMKRTRGLVWPREAEVETLRTHLPGQGTGWQEQRRQKTGCSENFLRLRSCQAVKCFGFRVMRKWWNWQTHHLEGVEQKGMRVQVPP